MKSQKLLFRLVVLAAFALLLSGCVGYRTGCCMGMGMGSKGSCCMKMNRCGGGGCPMMKNCCMKGKKCMAMQKGKDGKAMSCQYACPCGDQCACDDCQCVSECSAAKDGKKSCGSTNAKKPTEAS